jgi:hypothetical protein
LGLSEDKIQFERTLAKVNEIKNDEEREHYKKLLAEWNHEEQNKERSHRRKRDYRSFDDLENPSEMDGQRYRPPMDIKLRRKLDFEDIIFSESPNDLHELVGDCVLSGIIKSLTPTQKEALHYIIVLRYTASETAEILGVSDRNIRKIYETAMHHIRGKMYPIIKLRLKLEADEKYRNFAAIRGISTTKAERDFADRADEKIIRYYDK